MSSTDVATREAGAPARSGAPQSVLDVFNNAAFKQQVAAALPRHIGVDSMMRIALTEVRMNPDLAKCTVPSFMGALLKAAQSGLRPGMFGEGWIIPRWNGKLGSLEAAFQPGYMGLAQLAYRSGEVADILAEAVYASDHFRYRLGTSPSIEHEPDMEADHRDEDIVAFYAVVKLTNGGTLMKVMRRADVDEVRDRFGPKTKAGKIVGPWASDYGAMGRKTVLIQALKLAPKESERLQFALQAESDAIFGDRVAAGVASGTQSAAERVASRLGVSVDEDTGEVIDVDASSCDEEPAGDAAESQGTTDPDEAPGASQQAAEPNELDMALGNVAPIRPEKATKAQIAEIKKLARAGELYEAELAAIVDSYGAATLDDLTQESAGYVIQAIKERQR